ncbi:MAG TPA: hypothetical protein VMG59_01390 [Phycisphaerae bacterium]|nr:hypothetical protein [Phycisphaerae bacterium]
MRKILRSLALLFAAALVAAGVFTAIKLPVVYPKPPDTAEVYIQKDFTHPHVFVPDYMVSFKMARQYIPIGYRDALNQGFVAATGADLRVEGPPLWISALMPVYMPIGAWRHWKQIIAYGSEEPFFCWFHTATGIFSWPGEGVITGIGTVNFVESDYIETFSLWPPLMALVIMVITTWFSVRRGQKAAPGMLVVGTTLFIIWHGATFLIPVISYWILHVQWPWSAGTFLLLFSGGIGVVVKLIRLAIQRQPQTTPCNDSTAPCENN